MPLLGIQKSAGGQGGNVSVQAFLFEIASPEVRTAGVENIPEQTLFVARDTIHAGQIRNKVFEYTRQTSCPNEEKIIADDRASRAAVEHIRLCVDKFIKVTGRHDIQVGYEGVGERISYHIFGGVNAHDIVLQCSVGLPKSRVLPFAEVFNVLFVPKPILPSGHAPEGVV